MKFILAALLAFVLGACQSCKKDDVPYPPLVSQSSPAIAESETSFQPVQGVRLGVDAPAAIVVYKSPTPVAIDLNGSSITLTAPDTLYLGTGDTISIAPTAAADIRWIYVL
jgi:hypothetical protein